MHKYTNILKTLGPGILFASTAIGVSHLVQSTRAGAQYGFALLGFIILVNVLKYPFFEFGSRYANITGETLLEGYKKQGRWVLVVYFIITLLSMFTVVAAVSFVCSGIMSEIFSYQYDINYLILVLFIICIVVLVRGRFNVLDSVVKLIAIVLLVSTLLAFLFSFIEGPAPRDTSFITPVIFNDKGILFLIALMGWMPTAVDMSVWNSIWTIERIQQTNYQPSLKETLLDFNIGYILTIILAICFVSLGALLIYGTGQEIPDSSALFANTLIGLYTKSLGNWSYWIIAISAFSVMFGTTLAVFDGYSRAIQRTSSLLFNIKSSHKIYVVWLFIISIGSYLIIWQFISSFKTLIDLATTISFLIAPFCAVANHLAVHSSDIPLDKRPPRWLRILSILGIIFLVVFSIIFLFYV